MGETTIVAVANPAAGAEWIYALPAGYQYAFVSVVFRLTNSAAVANRILSVPIILGGNVLCRSKQMPALAASITGRLSLFSGCALGTVFDSYSTNPMPFTTDFIVPAATTIGTATLNLQAADQFSEIVLVLLRWQVNI